MTATRPMRVAVLGLGHVGVVTAACLAHLGHEVTGVDADEERVAALRRGHVPFHEPGLEELVAEGLANGRLTFPERLRDAVGSAEILFVCVGTPSRSSGAADLVQVERLTLDVAEYLDPAAIFVEKSTVPVTTGERVARTLARLRGRADVDVVSNPEFLREGYAIEDTLCPSRIVVGSASERATAMLLELYRPITDATDCPVIVTDVRTAELIKHASNAFLATKISFINAIAEVCDRAGADVEVVASGIGADPRIGSSFLRAGIGYGGSCLPKDVAGFAAMARELGCDLALLDEVRRINDRAPERLVNALRDELWHLDGKTVAVLGLSFKEGTDDVRASPALALVESLRREGARVVGFDPAAMHAAKQIVPEVHMASSALDAASGADALVIATAWPEFAALDLAELRSALRFPIVVDGRNVLDPDAMRRAGFTYRSVGRPAVAA
jgi:UDPglucose 6-dehydrogenase